MVDLKNLSSNIGDTILQTDNRKKNFGEPIKHNKGVLKFGSVYTVKSDYNNFRFIPLKYTTYVYQRIDDIPGDVLCLYITNNEQLLKGQCVGYTTSIISHTGDSIIDMQDEIQNNILIEALDLLNIDYRIVINI